MLGFAASMVGEHLTGQGALHQLSGELGITLKDTAAVLMGMTLANVAVALSPGSSEAPLDDPKGPLQDPRITLLEPKRFFSVTDFGFTPQNELFVGRLANLGFFLSVLGEWFTGKGILGQVQAETHIPAMDTEFFVGILAMAMLFAAAGKRD